MNIRHFFLIIFILINLVCSSQVKIPLSRTDSAEVVENDSISKYFLSIDNKKEASRHFDINATIYWRHNFFDEAVSYYNKSLKLNTQLGNWNGIAGINSNLAFIYADKGDYERSYDFFEKTLAVRKSKNERVGIISALVNESVVLNNLKKHDISIKKLEEALSLSQEINDETQMRSVFGMLSETYQKMGNVEKSLYYYEFYKTFNDYVAEKHVKSAYSELEKEKMQKNIIALEAEKKQLELEKQELLLEKQNRTIQNISKEQQVLIDSLSAQEMSLLLINQEAEIQKITNQSLEKKKKQQTNVITLILILVVVLLALLVLVFMLLRVKNINNKDLSIKNKFIYNQKEEIEAQRNKLMKINELLDYKNKENTHSLNYAQRIQKAILTKEQEGRSLFKDAFMFYLPQNVVSGDFYYLNKIDNYKKIVVVGDCTGHGVPGAFLTILGINILDNIINDNNIYTPSDIIFELDKQFYYNLNRKESDIHDGMDVSVCLIDEKNKILEYAGARNHLLFVKNKQAELIKGTKDSIGHKKESDFENVKYENNKIKLEENTWFYMFSDGMIDQFNDKGKKYLRKNLTKLLTEISDKTGEEQHKIVEQSFYDWKKDTDQIDDVIVMGFCI